MKVTSDGIRDGIIEDRYGKRGVQSTAFGMPTCSIPLRIENPPIDTVSFTLVLEDKDAVPVCGFSWIHWIAANIRRSEMMENESVDAKDFIQGINSWISEGHAPSDVCCYGGMSPPDAPHVYELHVFALDKVLDLEKGFYMNELFKAMEGHILSQVTIKGIYIN